MQSTTFCASGPANSRTAFRSSCDFNSALRVGTRLVEVISREMNSCHGVIEGVEMSVWALIPVDHLPTLCRRPVPPHNNLPKQSMLASLVNSAPVPVMVQPTAPTSTITLSAAYQLISTSPSPARIPRSSRVRAQRRPVPVWPAEERSLTSRTSRMCSTLTSIRNPAAVSAIPGPRISLNTLHPSELPAESGCWQNS